MRDSLYSFCLKLCLLIIVNLTFLMTFNTTTTIFKYFQHFFISILDFPHQLPCLPCPIIKIWNTYFYTFLIFFFTFDNITVAKIRPIADQRSSYFLTFRLKRTMDPGSRNNREKGSINANDL